MTSKTRSRQTSRRALQVVEEFARRSGAIPAPAWERALTRLRQALSDEAARGQTKLEHSAVQDILPFYVADQEQGAQIAQIYPEISAHLESCCECRDLYNLLVPPEAGTLARLRS